MHNTYILTFSCADHPTIVARVAGLLFQNGENIHDAQQFNDQGTGRFFMRVVFELATDIQKVSPQIDALAQKGV